MATKKSDPVNSPAHYTQGGIECIDAIKASMPVSSFRDFCKGNTMKYLWRFNDKGGLEDLKKAQVYLNWMVEAQENLEVIDIPKSFKSDKEKVNGKQSTTV